MTSAPRRIVTAQRPLDIICRQAETLGPPQYGSGSSETGSPPSFVAANGRNEAPTTNRADAARAVDEINPCGHRPTVVGAFPTVQTDSGL